MIVTFPVFMEWVNTTPAIFEDLAPQDFAAMRDRLQLPPELGDDIPVILFTLREKVSVCLNKTSGAGGTSLFKLCSMAVCHYLLEEGGIPGITVQVARELNDIHSFVDINTAADEWKLAIAYLKSMLNLSTPHYIDWERELSGAFNKAKAAERLTAYGATFSYDNEELDFASGERQVVERLEAIITFYGGLPIIKRVFDYLHIHTYHPELKKYVLSCKTSAWPWENAPAPPFAYLLNLCAKFPFNTNRHTIDTARWLHDIEELLTIAKDMLTIAGGQRHHPMTAILAGTNRLTPYLIETLIFDASFYISQSDLETELQDCQVLFNWVDDQVFLTKCNFSINDLLDVVKEIKKIVGYQIGPVYIYQSKISKRMGSRMTSNTLQLILSELSHQYNQVNETFQLLTDYNYVNVGQRLLVRASEKHDTTKFILYDRSWLAPAVYETITRLCKNAFGQQASAEVGKKLEILVQSIFHEAGINTKTGKYRHGNYEGDCDLVIETTEVIVLLEVKKSPLTNRSRTGAASSIFANLAETLVKSQEQAGKTELILRQQGRIELTNEQTGEKASVSLNGRKIYRIAVTHRDFYSLQDQTWVSRFLDLLLDTEITILEYVNPPKDIVDKFKKLNKTLKSLTDQYLQLFPDDKAMGADRPYFNCMFLSLPMLRMLLAKAKSAEDFLANIEKIKYITFGTGNFYREYLLASERNINTAFAKEQNISLLFLNG